MFDPKQTLQPNSSLDLDTKEDNSSKSNPADLNSAKEFPFKKVDENKEANKFAPEKSLAGNKGPAEDILAGTDKHSPAPSNLASNNFSPTPSGPVLKDIPSVPSMSGHSEIDEQPRPVMTEKKDVHLSESAQTNKFQQNKPKKSSWFTILIVIAAIVILGLAGIYAYQYFTQSSQDEQTPDESLQELLDMLDQEGVQTEENIEFEEVLDLDQEEIIEDTSEIMEEEQNFLIDTDADGLLDEREFELGTNPNQFDTDNDGLNDFEEVEIYGSNPIQADTDGDGYNDGDEVQQGYDPLMGGGARL